MRVSAPERGRPDRQSRSWEGCLGTLTTQLTRGERVEIEVEEERASAPEDMEGQGNLFHFLGRNGMEETRKPHYDGRVQHGFAEDGRAGAGTGENM